MSIKRNLTALLVSDGATRAGGAMTTTAMPFIVLGIGGAEAALAAVATAIMVPQLVALVVGGVLADRMPRQRLMFIADIIQAGSIAALAVMFIAGDASVTAIIVLSAVRGIGMGLFMPASDGIMPQIVDLADLVRANSLRRFVETTMQIGGALLGGAVVGFLGAAVALWTIASLFVIGALSRLAMIGIRPQQVGNESMIEAAVNGWKEFASRRWLWSVVVGFAIINAFEYGYLGVLGPMYVEEHFDGAASWGLIGASMSAGAALGAVVAFKWRPQRPLVAGLTSAGVLALGPLSLAVSPVLAGGVIGAGIAGIGVEVFGIFWVTVVQQRIPGEALSRVFSLDAIGSFAVMPIGPVIASIVVARIGVLPGLYATSLVMIAVVVLMLLVPEVRAMRQPEAVASS